jgi:DNA repair protein RadC
MTYYEATVIKKRKQKEKKIRTGMDAYNLVKKYAKSRQEQCILITLGGDDMVIGIHLVHIGSSNTVHTSLKEIFFRAIKDNASKIITCHNHTNGSLEPSDDDFKSAHAYFISGNIFDIPVMMDMIVTEYGYTSINMNKKFEFPKEEIRNAMTYETIVKKEIEYKNKIENPQDLFQIVYDLYKDETKLEQMVLVTFNILREIINIHLIHVGEVDKINIGFMNPRTVLTKCLIDEARSVAICYIRPSKELTPTENDFKNAENILAGTKMFGIPVKYQLLLNQWGFTEIKQNIK